jgi:hypothetical protein
MLVMWKGPVRIAEVWFDEPLSCAADIVEFNQRPHPVQNACVTPKCTLLLELGKPSEELFGSIKRNTRYEIRRAEGCDHLTCAIWDSPTDASLESFCQFYGQFAAQKGLPPAQAQRLRAMTSAGMLKFSVATKDGEALVWHSYIVARGRARLLYSASLFREVQEPGRRNLVGRANRWLHWQDILHFKAHGYNFYDFGGWHEGGDPGLVRINQFKEEFGGVMERSYNCELAVTTTGKLVLPLFWVKRRLRQRK